MSLSTQQMVYLSEISARRLQRLYWRGKKKKVHFFLHSCRSFSTCAALFPLLCRCCSCCLAPFCWPAGLPRPLNCGCSSPEQFLLHGSSETHLLLDLTKVCGDVFFCFFFLNYEHFTKVNMKKKNNNFSLSKNSRDTVEAILPRSNVQRRVSVDVNSVHITIGIQEQHSDIHTAWECRPVKADVLFLAYKVPKDKTKSYFVKICQPQPEWPWWLTLSLMLMSAPLDRSSFTWSTCLYSVAQIMGVQPPSSWLTTQIIPLAVQHDSLSKVDYLAILSKLFKDCLCKVCQWVPH